METDILKIIEKKRDGKSLSKEEINFFIEKVVKKEIPDYQISALLMAIYINGMDEDETLYLTEAMRNSGKTIYFENLHPLIDKHSTGGVGDKVSLALAPLVACYGIYVPMISGRALGHTGGTVDKLESIPGYKTDLEVEEFKKIVKDIGFSIIGQSEEIAPADRILYALRDVTGTVPSIPLITASILSKKLSVNLDGIVFDVKTGEGAFMTKFKDAVKLAESLINVSKKMGVEAKALITDMNEPLGVTVGNRLEVMEVLFYLNGSEIKDLDKVVKTLGALMLVMGKKTEKIENGFEMIEKARKNGMGLKKFFELVEKHGGDTQILDFSHIDDFIRSNCVEFVESDVEGYITRMNARYVGEAARVLGAGRLKKEDKIIPEAGIIIHKKLGDYVKRGEKIFEIRCREEKRIEIAKKLLLKSLDFSLEKPPDRIMIYKAIR